MTTKETIKYLIGIFEEEVAELKNKTIRIGDYSDTYYLINDKIINEIYRKIEHTQILIRMLNKKLEEK